MLLTAEPSLQALGQRIHSLCTIGLRLKDLHTESPTFNFLIWSLESISEDFAKLLYVD